MTRATLRTTHTHPDVVAAALRPDNTDEMSTDIAGDRVVTTIERDTPDGLRSTVDDYVMNLAVATRVTRIVDERQTTNP